jgi:4a-hydroxytetrahydrobiopterin dehydratase
MTGLAGKHPYEREKGSPALTTSQIQEYMPELPGWTVENGRLVREVTVKNFGAALDLVNRIGRLAEQENHHPDICIRRWNHVRVEFYTHTVEGLTENDLIMAAKINRLEGMEPKDQS